MAENELISPEGTEQVGQDVIDILNEVLKYREEERVAEKFTRFYKLRKGQHWKNQNNNRLVSANLIGAHHSRTVNMLTDNNPTFNAVPAVQLQDDEENKLSLLVKTIDNWWRETEQQHVFEKSVSTGEMYGLVGEVITYNPDINFPEGDVETETIDPLYCSYYPPRCQDRDKAEAALWWRKMTVREARRQWPDVADQIQGDVSLLSQINDNRHEESAKASRTRTYLDSIVRYLSGSTEASKADDDELFVVTCWVKDYTEDEQRVAKYPGRIRRIQVCNAGDLVLDDQWNPSINKQLDPDTLIQNYLYSRFPLNMAQSVTDPSSPFGFSDFEQLEQLNIEVNKTLSQFTHFKDRTAGVKVVNPKDSGVPNSDLDNQPGIVNPTNSLVAKAIGYMNPPQMPVDIAMGMSLYKDLFHEIAGTFADVTQGKKGSGSEVIAAKAIAMLLEEASRMARGKIRNYSKLLRERGRMYVALAQMWYDTDRFITHQQDGKEITEPVNRDVLQIAGRINVVSGSTMPVSHIQRREEAMALAQMGMIDQEELLRVFQWDNYKDVVTRMQQGPLMEYLQKLGTLGVPEPVIKLFQQIAGMDPKEIQRAIEGGELPHFMQIVQQLMGQQQEQPPDPEMIKAQLEQQKLQIQAQAAQQKAQSDATKAQADAHKAQVDAQKVMAEIELIKAKIESELIEQQVRAYGVELDKQNIRIRKAEAIANIRAKQQHEAANAAKTAADVVSKTNTDTGGYSERGMSSNNKDGE
jgi:hypothetical protein